MIWYYIAGALLIAGVSWVDDLYRLPNRLRFAVHSLGALLIVGGIGPWQQIALPILGPIRTRVGWRRHLPFSGLWGLQMPITSWMASTAWLAAKR